MSRPPKRQDGTSPRTLVPRQADATQLRDMLDTRLSNSAALSMRWDNRWRFAVDKRGSCVFFVIKASAIGRCRTDFGEWWTTRSLWLPGFIGIIEAGEASDYLSQESTPFADNIYFFLFLYYLLIWLFSSSFISLSLLAIFPLFLYKVLFFFFITFFISYFYLFLLASLLAVFSLFSSAPSLAVLCSFCHSFLIRFLYLFFFFSSAHLFMLQIQHFTVFTNQWLNNIRTILFHNYYL